MLLSRSRLSWTRERSKHLPSGPSRYGLRENKGTVHDFEKDPIELVRKGNMLMANGTTLGADNGIAVATNLAIMEDKIACPRTA